MILLVLLALLGFLVHPAFFVLLAVVVIARIAASS